MDPDALLHPVGPLPAGTYWVRRAILVAGLLVAVVLSATWLNGGRDGPPAGGTGATHGSPSPVSDATSTGTSPAPRPSPSAVAPAAAPQSPRTCANLSLAVTASTDARTYPAGVQPVLTMTVKNVGGVACVRDLGVGARGLTVRSGTDRIWSSNDCEGSGTAMVTLAPGAARSYAVRWSRLRSHPGCPSPGPPGRPGTYRLFATLRGVTSAPAVFALR